MDNEQRKRELANNWWLQFIIEALEDLIRYAYKEELSELRDYLDDRKYIAIPKYKQSTKNIKAYGAQIKTYKILNCMTVSIML